MAHETEETKTYPQHYSGEYKSLEPETLLESYPLTAAIRESAEKLVLDIVEPNGVPATLTFQRQERNFWKGDYRRRDGSDPEQIQMHTAPYPDDGEEMVLVMSRLEPDGRDPMGMAELTKEE